MKDSPERREKASRSTRYPSRRSRWWRRPAWTGPRRRPAQKLLVLRSLSARPSAAGVVPKAAKAGEKKRVCQWGTMLLLLLPPPPPLLTAAAAAAAAVPPDSPSCALPPLPFRPTAGGTIPGTRESPSSSVVPLERAAFLAANLASLLALLGLPRLRGSRRFVRRVCPTETEGGARSERRGLGKATLSYDPLLALFMPLSALSGTILARRSSSRRNVSLNPSDYRISMDKESIFPDPPTHARAIKHTARHNPKQIRYFSPPHDQRRQYI